MSNLILIRGLPGSCKSTLAKTFDCFHIEADMFFVRNGEYKWFHTGKNHEWCLEMVENCIVIGMDIVISNTFTQIWEMQKYLGLAEEYNYNIRVISCQNEFKNKHSVPEETLKKMKGRWELFPGEEIYKVQL